MAPQFFRLLLIIVVLYALLRGGRDERAVAILCLAGFVTSALVLSPLNDRFEGIETGVLLIDVGLFIGFAAVAMMSDRFWPLWVAGLQLTTMVGHMFKGVDAELIPKAYAASIGMWSYPILLILALGTWRCYLYRDDEPSNSGTTG